MYSSFSASINLNVCHLQTPDIVIVNKMEKTSIIIDVAIPGNKRIIDKEKKKIKMYQNLRRKIQRLWNLWNGYVLKLLYQIINRFVVIYTEL